MLGATFNGGTGSIYLGGTNATFTGGSAAASFGLLGVYGTGNAATLLGTAGDIAPSDAGFSPATRDSSGVTQIGGQGAAFFVRSDASNVNMTFNGCQIGVACGGEVGAGGAGTLESQTLVDRLYDGGFGQPGNELDLTNTVNDESLEDKRRKSRWPQIGALP